MSYNKNAHPSKQARQHINQQYDPSDGIGQEFRATRTAKLK